jgi:hypothetical protein
MGTPALFSPVFLFAGAFFTGIFCAGLSALTRCDLKYPARWAGLLCRRGSALVAAATGPCTGTTNAKGVRTVSSTRARGWEATRTGTTNAKGVRTAKGRVAAARRLPCLLRPMHNNPNGVAHAGAI